MKLILALFAILTVSGLGQAHMLPDFGNGPLYEDIQDVIDMLPAKEINNVFFDYLYNDAEFQEVLNFFWTTTVFRDLVVDVEVIPEVINFMNYLQKNNVDIYWVVNELNKALRIKELEPPSSYQYYTQPMKRTGGIAGFFKDIMKLNYNDFRHTYVQKMQTSSDFVSFVQEIKSDNFQQIVNKVYSSKNFKIIHNGLRKYGVNVQVVEDLLYIAFGITVPKYQLSDFDRSLLEEIMDFLKLIPLDQFLKVVTEYITKDQKVQKALGYAMNPEFHNLLRDLENTKEHQALVVNLEKMGIPAIKAIQEFHRAIGMDEYVPPKIKSMFESQIGVEKVGEGMKAMLDDLATLLPTEKIQGLYDEKMKTTNAFSDFIKKLNTPEMKKIVLEMYGHPTYQKLSAKCLEQGLDLKALSEFYKKMIPIPLPSP